MEPLLEACSPALRPHLSLTLEEHLDFLDRTPPLTWGWALTP